MKRIFITSTFMLIFFASQQDFAQVARSSWNFGFGFTYPRFLSTDVRPQEQNYGGYLSLQRYFSEKVSLRIKASYLSMKGRIGGGQFFYTNGAIVPSMTEFTRTNMLSGNFDLLYNLSPCSPVSPYFGAGVGITSYKADWPAAVVNPEANKSDYAGEINIIFGSEWRLNDKWKIDTEFGLHSLNGNFDGIGTVNRLGVFGSNSDAYLTVSAGVQYYFAKGEPSKYCQLYEGIKVEMPPMNYPTLDQIEEVIKRYSTEPTTVDYNRIEDIVKRYRGATAANTNWILFGVNFEFNKSSLTPEAYPILDHAAEVLKDNTNLKVEIQGHTDNIGSDSYNQKLSEARAKTVRDYLVKNGVDASRLTTVGFGKTKPIADNSTDMGRAQNRRVEFKVTQ